MSKPARNEPCPCGSGKKYKSCCLSAEVAAPPSRPGRYRFEPGSYGGPGHQYFPSIGCLKWDAEQEAESYHFVLVKAEGGFREEDQASRAATADLDQAFGRGGRDAEAIAGVLREKGYLLVDDFRVIGE
jgi:hypothetical protein